MDEAGFGVVVVALPVDDVPEQPAAITESAATTQAVASRPRLLVLRPSVTAVAPAAGSPAVASSKGNILPCMPFKCSENRTARRRRPTTSAKPPTSAGTVHAA